jgi:hypothetical protein
MKAAMRLFKQRERCKQNTEDLGMCDDAKTSMDEAMKPLTMEEWVTNLNQEGRSDGSLEGARME